MRKGTLPEWVTWYRNRSGDIMQDEQTGIMIPERFDFFPSTDVEKDIAEYYWSRENIDYLNQTDASLKVFLSFAKLHWRAREEADYVLSSRTAPRQNEYFSVLNGTGNYTYQIVPYENVEIVVKGDFSKSPATGERFRELVADGNLRCEKDREGFFDEAKGRYKEAAPTASEIFKPIKGPPSAITISKNEEQPVDLERFEFLSDDDAELSSQRYQEFLTLYWIVEGKIRERFGNTQDDCWFRFDDKEISVAMEGLSLIHIPISEICNDYLSIELEKRRQEIKALQNEVDMLERGETIY